MCTSRALTDLLYTYYAWLFVGPHSICLWRFYMSMEISFTLYAYDISQSEIYRQPTKI